MKRASANKKLTSKENLFFRISSRKQFEAPNCFLVYDKNEEINSKNWRK